MSGSRGRYDRGIVFNLSLRFYLLCRGGFGKGIHNTLEAAIYGIPVLFGPKYHKFKEAVDLIACGGAFSISDKEQFTSLMDSLINSPAIADAAGQSALKFVNQQLGATDVIIRQLVD